MEQVLYFAEFDADGYPIGFFPSDIWPIPPAGAVEITEAQYVELLKGSAVYVDGEVEKAPPKTMVTMGGEE